jgi:hypothetical protein
MFENPNAPAGKGSRASQMESAMTWCGIIAKETGTETSLRSLSQTLSLGRFRVRDLRSRSRCLARRP